MFLILSTFDFAFVFRLVPRRAGSVFSANSSEQSKINPRKSCSCQLHYLCFFDSFARSKMGDMNFSLTTFNKTGKLMQIEYALARVQQGKMALGIKGY